ncbi:MAG: hypothetical protein WBH85_18555, partial [Thermoanaerobaculia bacterium]
MSTKKTPSHQQVVVILLLAICLCGTMVATTTAGDDRPPKRILDLDIVSFEVTTDVVLGEDPVTIRMDIRINGRFKDSRPATVVGVQNNVQIYSETVMVFPPLGGNIGSVRPGGPRGEVRV